MHVDFKTSKVKQDCKTRRYTGIPEEFGSMSPSKQRCYRSVKSGGFNHDSSSNIFLMLFCLSATILYCVRVIQVQGFVYEHKIVTCCNSSLYLHGSSSLMYTMWTYFTWYLILHEVFIWFSAAYLRAIFCWCFPLSMSW